MGIVEGGKMTGSDRIATLRQARGLLAQVIKDCELPQIEAIVRSADMELYWALWNLGEFENLRPEMDYAD